jgi:hypothetical protein
MTNQLNWANYFAEGKRSDDIISGLNYDQAHDIVQWVKNSGLIEDNGERREFRSSIEDANSDEAVIEHAVSMFLIEPWFDKEHPLRALSNNPVLMGNFVFGSGILRLLQDEQMGAGDVYRYITVGKNVYRVPRCVIIELMVIYLQKLGVTEDKYGDKKIYKDAWDSRE